MSEDEIVRRLHREAELSRSARDRALAETHRQQRERELAFANAVRSAAPFLLEHFEGELRPILLTVSRNILFWKWARRRRAAAWVLHEAHSSGSADEWDHVRYFGLTHTGIVFDTFLDDFCVVKSQDVAGRFRQHPEAFQRLGEMCEVAGLALPELPSGA